MKNILITIILLFTFSIGFCSDWVAINSAVPVPAKTKLISSDINHSVVNFSLAGFQMKAVETPHGIANIISLEGTSPIIEAGSPDLVKITAPLIIPDLAEMNCRVLSSSFKDFDNIEIAPSKGNISRETDPSTIPFTFGDVYSVNSFSPGILSGTREPYIVRDVRGQTLIAYPFQYNPISKKLRVYYDLTLELYQTDETGQNPFYRKDQDLRINASFRPVFSRHFLNFDQAAYTPLGEYGRILVISHGAFMETMQPYVSWKNAMGYPTEMVDVSTIGTTTTAIKNYIANYYNEKGLSFVLLVGDAAQIPTNTGSGLGGPSDNAYGYITGNDHYPEVFIGRFSAETTAHVQTQVQRTINYERNPQLLTDDWFSTVIGIGSDQGPGDDGEYDYEHIRNLQTVLLDYTYTWNPELFDGTQGGNDDPGDPNPTKVATAVNEGASLILYCGHGSQTSWGTSGFSNANVNSLTNQDKLPFIWSVACVNGQFNSGTCFAEAWLRASKNGQPTGAVAFLGSTINQSWNPPMEGQDEMVAILSETYPDNIKRTFGGLSMNGCMKMMDSFGSDGRKMADTWTIFGDPSLTVRTSNPDTLLVSNDTLLNVGSSVLLVNCNLDGARVTATINDTILSTGLVSGGLCELNFPALENSGDTLHLLVTAYNNLPYFSNVYIINAQPVTAMFEVSDTNLVRGGSAIFTDQSIGGVNSWLWNFPGGNPSVSTEQNPVVVYDSVGVFDVELTVSNGFNENILVRTGYIHVDFASALTEKNNGLDVSLYPNPNKGYFTLHFLLGKEEFVNIQIFDMTGNKVYQEDLNLQKSKSLPVNLTLLPSGVYFLKVNGSESTVSRKIILQK